MGDINKSVKILLSEEPKQYKQFKSVNEIQEWLSAEKSAWGWIRDDSSAFRKELNRTYLEIESILDRILASNDQERSNSLATELVELLDEKVKQNKFIASESPEGRFVLLLRSGNKNMLAAGALNYLRGYHIPVQNAHMMQYQQFFSSVVNDQLYGFFHASEFKSGVTASGPIIKAFEAEMAEKGQVASDLLGGLGKSLEESRVNHAQHSGNLISLNAALTDAVEKAKADSESAVAHLKSRATEIENVYKEKVQLQAPVQYFEKQFKSHNLLSWIYLGIFSVGTGIFLWGFYKLIVFLFSHADGMKEIEKYLLLAGFFTFGTWGVRILYKMFLNHQHLKTVAGEKGLLIKVYLSLIENDKNLSQEDRGLILGPLFRVPQNVFSKDDSASASPMEILLRNLHK